ncbi:MAG: 16S rRNA (adenine(1518)-N(6)/adenine(1519)-N(6))-dimethyltransferase RsmA [Candidatus Dormibacterales bacterium]
MIDPADSRQLEAILRRHRIDLRHRLGQNFLTDMTLRDSIALATGATSEDVVVEVGAGVGTLTIALAPVCRELIAIELDERLVEVLRETTAPHPNVHVVHEDVLRFDFRASFPLGGEVVAGNIPYHLTGALVRKLLDLPHRPRRLAFVVQKEVAERWTATTGASLSTVAVQVFTSPRIALNIAARSFTPPPKVDSALVVLEVRERPAVTVDDLNRFFRLVEAVFQSRRKQLGGTLARVSGIERAEAAERLDKLGIDPTRRPQTLTLQEWERVYGGFGGSALVNL